MGTIQLKQYIIRLDDSSEHMNLEKWLRMKRLLDKYNIKPIFGIIPDNKDPDLLQYEEVPGYWDLVKQWITEGWKPAMHGYMHVFETNQGGINPVNNRSEFAGMGLDKQREKIRKGYEILSSHGIKTDIFFAPAHTFDLNTLNAIYKETPIRIINDTPAWDAYYKEPFYFIPQQSGRVRNLPFRTTTFCYHPNTMNDEMFVELERFLESNGKKFANEVTLSRRKFGLRDQIVSKLYFGRIKLRRLMLS